MSYPTLEKLFYKDSSAERFQHHESLLRERLEAESTFRTGIMLEHGELFCSVPRELSVLHEQVLRRERRVSALWKSLPTGALGAFIRSLILDEVVYSNEIEGVHSTRRQIEAALEQLDKEADTSEKNVDKKHLPFVEFAKLYLGLTDNPARPDSLQHIRDIYDAVVRDSLDERDQIRGSLFRTGPVVIEDHKGKQIHQGAQGEDAIRSLLAQMLALTHSEEIPETYSALIAHFLFEYIHPFYDGNGRTGRYLLALDLSRPLSLATVLSLSRTIAENKAAYYKAFDTVERPMNCSEVTCFVLLMLELIGQAQESLSADLEMKRATLDGLNESIDELEAPLSSRARNLLYLMAQITLFGAFEETRLKEAAEFLEVSIPTARKELRALTELALAEKVSARPASYRLTERGKGLLGLSNPAQRPPVHPR